MKILIISGTFYPKNSPRALRTTELVKEFSRTGHEITLYIPEMGYDYMEFQRKCPVVINHYEENLENDKYIGVKLLDRIIKHYEYWLIKGSSLRSMRNLGRVIKDEIGFDLLITIAVPHYIHWAIGKVYAKGQKIAKTWVADCGDPFMLNATDAHRPPFWFKPLEKRWCMHCDYISVPTETSYLGYYPEFKDKIKVIPQGFNFDETPIDDYQKNEIPTFAYAGGFFKKKRDPRELFEFLISIDKPYRFIIFDGKEPQLIEPYKEKMGDRLIVKKPVPRNELLLFLSKMDFLINIGNNTKVQTPSKLIDYTLAKRPILTIESNDIRKEILMEFLEGNYEHRDSEIDISKYDIHKVALQFVELCKTK